MSDQGKKPETSADTRPENAALATLMGTAPAPTGSGRGLRTKRETWYAWLPDGAPKPRVEDLLTREELLARLRRIRPVVTETALRSWERKDVLPHPIRQWHEGSVRALYPPWYPDLVRQLRRLQRDGYPLAAIGGELYAYVQQTQGRTPIGTWRRERIVLSLQLVEEVQRLADDHARITGEPAISAQVWIVTRRGKTVYPLPLAPTESDDTPDAPSRPPTESK